LLLGGTMRSSCDTFRISRAKLAYLVDSTAAPVAGLALISTWVVTEMTLIGEGLALAEPPVEATAFQVFLSSLPYRFYPILAIALVAIVAITGRDFGPMRTAEQAAWDGEGSDGEGSDGEGTDGEGTDGEATAGSPSLGRSWLAACLPIFACLGSVIAVLIVTGRGALGGAAATDSGIAYWGEVIGNSDSYLAMIVGGAVGSLVALATGGWAQQGSRLPALLAGAVRGAGQILPAMVVLWLAWALSEMTGDTYLDTGGYLAGWLQEGFPGWCLPTVVFLVAAGVAFSTGTSWGTMGILTPLSISLALQLDASGGLEGAIVLATSGAVLAGAIFGDHCSPISDTTVLSSRASGCDHVAHVRTQMPYALLAGGVSIGVGTIPSALGLSPWISLVVGIGVLLLAVRVIMKPLHETVS